MIVRVCSLVIAFLKWVTCDKVIRAQEDNDRTIPIENRINIEKRFARINPSFLTRCAGLRQRAPVLKPIHIHSCEANRGTGVFPFTPTSPIFQVPKKSREPNHLVIWRIV
jgi:hypothetical protein